MTEATPRVPQPTAIGSWGSEMLERIKNSIPEGRGYEGAHRPSDFFEHIPEETNPVARIIQPAAKLAIMHYQLDKGAEATEATITIRHSAADSTPKNQVERWHRDGLYPDENHYIMASHTPTEFVQGDGIPLLNSLPVEVSIHAVTNRLLATGYLHLSPTAENVLTVFNDRHIHRRPEIHGESRVSLSISLFSRELALAGIYKNRHRYLKFWWQARKPAENF